MLFATLYSVTWTLMKCGRSHTLLLDTSEVRVAWSLLWNVSDEFGCYGICCFQCFFLDNIQISWHCFDSIVSRVQILLLKYVRTGQNSCSPHTWDQTDEHSSSYYVWSFHSNKSLRTTELILKLELKLLAWWVG